MHTRRCVPSPSSIGEATFRTDFTDLARLPGLNRYLIRMAGGVESLSNADGVGSGTRGDARLWEICESFYGPTVPLMEPCDRCGNSWCVMPGARPCYMWACATWIILISCYLRWTKAFERVFPDPLDYEAFVNSDRRTQTMLFIYGVALCLHSLSLVLKETTARIAAAVWCSRYRRRRAANRASRRAAERSDPFWLMAAKFHLEQLCNSQWLCALTGRCVNVTRMGATHGAKWQIRILHAVFTCSYFILWDVYQIARPFFLVILTLFVHARIAMRRNMFQQFKIMALIQLRKAFVFSFVCWTLVLLVRYILTRWELSRKGARLRSLPPNFPYLPDGRQFVSDVYTSTVFCYCYCNYRLPSHEESDDDAASAQPDGQHGSMRCYMSAFSEYPPRQHMCDGFAPQLLPH